MMVGVPIINFPMRGVIPSSLVQLWTKNRMTPSRFRKMIVMANRSQVYIAIILRKIHL